MKEDNTSSSSSNETKEKVPANGLPGPEVIESAEAVEEEQDIDEQQANEQQTSTAMSTGDTVMEEIQTSFDHEETIENVGNEETIGDEDMNDKNSFRVSELRTSTVIFLL